MGASWKLAAAALLWALVPVLPATAGPTGEWRFDVSLDGRPIGVHTFRVSRGGDATEVDSRASFDVSFLGFSVYAYEHHAVERWSGDCLAALKAETDDNGEKVSVTGTLAGAGFEVARTGGSELLPACTMTFAYWNPAFRRQSRLLNPQTGRYLDVRIEADGRETIDAEGAKVEAERYVVRGKDLEIRLWYAVEGDRWLALESRTEGGRTVSYRLAAPAQASAHAAPDAVANRSR